MSGRETVIVEIEEYIKKLLAEIHLDADEKREVEEEWKQHLYDHYYSLRKRDVEKKAAIETVISQFGNISMLKEEINQTYPSSIKKHIQKEFTVAIICFIASIVGPIILIRASFSVYFLVATLTALLIGYVSYRFIIKKQTFWLFSILGLVPIYIVFIQLMKQMIGIQLTFDIYLNQIFSLNWNELTGSNGLFEFTTLHMMWYLVIAMQIISSRNYIPVWQRICNASFHYWAMLLLGLFFAKIQSSSEWATIYLNVFLLYSFLQQVISIDWILLFRQKVSSLFVRRVL
ncbi:permease prefix domain 1-containing protein [Fredinandcohnia sp. 179-A 10B2 NHS]|uniref:permease prefix domain 1-containing protein n=1 Tax=Fredinandcohnia sp. 179-A 10B2 NHS TaxID=3235176 RepID=UPI0039A3B98F